MNCPKCNYNNPEDSRFCIGCGAPFAASSAPVEGAATGPTQRLDPATITSASNLPDTTVPDMTTMPTTSGSCSGHGLGKLSGAVWLIGLGILFLTKAWWPGILLLIGLSGFMGDSQRGHQQQGLRSLIFFCGLALLFWTRLFWPGIFFLLALTALLSPEFRGRHA